MQIQVYFTNLKGNNLRTEKKEKSLRIRCKTLVDKDRVCARRIRIVSIKFSLLNSTSLSEKKTNNNNKGGEGKSLLHNKSDA